jgi:hypothetical protein
VRISIDNFATLVAEDRPIPELENSLYDLLRASNGTAHIVIVDSDRAYRVSATSNGPLPRDLWINIGCLTKLITSVTFLSVHGGFSENLSARIVDLLDIEAPPWFSSITVKDLLNHTHGIDVDYWGTLHRNADGLIDVRALLREMSSVPLTPTGMYSYSSIGPRLLAAIAERQVRQPFLEVARQTMGSIFPSVATEEAFCPAMGGRMRINVEQLLLHLVRVATYANPLQHRNVRLGPANVHNYPGWHPFEKGICVGWKTYNHNWFGHIALDATMPICVRVSPSDGRGILVCSSGISPQKVLAEMFAEPLLGGVNRPRASAGVPASKSRYVGTYARGKNRMVISLDGSELKLDAQRPGNSEATAEPISHTARLLPVPGTSMFSVTPPSHLFKMSFIEFLLDKTGTVTHMWNTGFLWRKQTEADAVN